MPTFIRAVAEPAAESTDPVARLPARPPQRPERHAARRLEATWATCEGDVRAAQRLRHRVFAVEMGASLEPIAGAPPGHDVDRFDAHCEHVLVRAAMPGCEVGEVIGTYRVMTPDGARRAGGGYADTEFDLQPLAGLRHRMLELGRSCIDPAWRTGGAVMMLWSAIGEFMVRHRLDIAFGAASIGLGDGGRQAANVWHRLAAAHLAPAERRVRPWRRLPAWQADGRGDVDADAVEIPPLIKGYVRCGAELLGPPAWDPEFGCADLPMLMPLAGLPQRHRRHFLGHLEPAAGAASD